MSDSQDSAPVKWIFILFIELLNLILLILLFPLSFFPFFQKSKGIGQPILLVHGYMNFGAVWAFLRYRLLQKGFGPIYVLNLGYPFSSIKTYAAKVNRAVEKIAKETGRSDVVLIGHSMGGLVVAWAALQHPGRIDKVIMVGSPLKGCSMAQIGFGKNGREMEKGSSFLQELEQEMKKNTSLKFYCVATHFDELVFPGETALLGQDAKQEMLVHHLGHLGLVWSPKVADRIALWLRGCLKTGASSPKTRFKRT